MTFNEKQHNQRLVTMIADSFFEDMYSWLHSPKINCYAFARGLTFPDVNNNIYAPGKIAQMQFGCGPVALNEYDPSFIDTCINNDSLALKQPCERVSFQTIKEDDCNFYFATTVFNSSSIADKKSHLHFICRTESGLWLHKPSWFQEAQPVQWIEYGKKFKFKALALDLRSTLDCVGMCFEDFFYKTEIPE